MGQPDHEQASPQAGRAPRKKQTKAEKTARMAEIRRRVAAQRERERRAERRRGIAVAVAGTLTAAGVIAALSVVVVRSNNDAKSKGADGDGATLVAEVKPAPGASGPIQGVRAFTASQGHEAKREIRYEQTPPVGGQHDPAWLNCGTYPDPVAARNAVHSMEHGAVWLTYRPDLPPDQVELLKSKVKGRTYVILSPSPDLPTPVVASAWGLQLPVPGVGDPRLDEFLKTYREGSQTPEPGASCSGGVGRPA